MIVIKLHCLLYRSKIQSKTIKWITVQFCFVWIYLKAFCIIRFNTYSSIYQTSQSILL